MSEPHKLVDESVDRGGAPATQCEEREERVALRPTRAGRASVDGDLKGAEESDLEPVLLCEHGQRSPHAAACVIGASGKGALQARLQSAQPGQQVVAAADELGNQSAALVSLGDRNIKAWQGGRAIEPNRLARHPYRCRCRQLLRPSSGCVGLVSVAIRPRAGASVW